MENKKKSVMHRTKQLMGIQLILMITVLCAFIVFSYLIASENLKKTTKNLMDIYAQELTYKLVDGEILLEQLLYNNDSFDILRSASESDRFYAQVELKKQLGTFVYDQYVDAVVIAEGNYGICLDYHQEKMKYNDIKNLRNYTMAYAREGHQRAVWTLAKIGGKTYLHKMYRWLGEAVSVYYLVDNFMNYSMDETTHMTLVLADDEDRIWAVYGEEAEAFQMGETYEDHLNVLADSDCIEIADGQLRLYPYVNAVAVLGQIRLHMVVLLLFILILFIFSAKVIQYIRGEIIGPMASMQQHMKAIHEGEYELRITESYDSREFSELKTTFNELMDEIVNLKIESYERQISLQNAELKSIRLQIRPHFFLNAMTMISSLSVQGKNEEIQQYIAALAKNVRYMFRAGLHTVTLADEVAHVENYFEMQELKYPERVFYFIEIAPEAEAWCIPQMLIHTIIENEYKYAFSMEAMLSILIKAEVVYDEGEPMLYLTIEDDGRGYPEEFLQRFSERINRPSDDGSRIGLWSISNMLQLMYEREDLFQIENIAPHGCRNVFRIPNKPLHEVDEGRHVKID